MNVKKTFFTQSLYCALEFQLHCFRFGRTHFHVLRNLYAYAARTRIQIFILAE